MKLSQYLLMALEGMMRHKLRTLLTLLGLVVGISSVLVMTGIGRGVGESAQEFFNTLLPNKLTLSPAFEESNGIVRFEDNSFTMREVETLQRLLGKSSVIAVTPSIDTGDLSIKGIDSANSGQYVSIKATTVDYAKTENVVMLQGRFFSTQEDKEAQSVAVVNDELFSALQSSGQFEGDSLPQVMFINNIPFQIVGVMQSNFFYGGGLQAFIPIRLLENNLRSQSVTRKEGYLQVQQIDVLAEDVAHIDQAKREMEQVLRLLHNLPADQKNDFSIQANNQFVQGSQDYLQTYTLFLSFIGGISLFVGGIGIMNILLAAVAERTREIGVRKAVGASDWDILVQFLFESIIICLIGGLLGVGFSLGISRLLSSFGTLNALFGELNIIIDLRSILIATLTSVTCGVVFGLYPAIRAMQLDPIQAIRYE